MTKFESIEIDIGDPKDRTEIAEGLRTIANDIERGCYSGIAGWSDVSWSLKLSDEEDIDKEE